MTHDKLPEPIETVLQMPLGHAERRVIVDLEYGFAEIFLRSLLLFGRCYREKKIRTKETTTTTTTYHTMQSVQPLDEIDTLGFVPWPSLSAW